MGHYSTIKKNIDVVSTLGKTQNNPAEWKKPDKKKEYIPGDPIYIKS